MEESQVHIDGNGIAGMLQEIFVSEITAATRQCDSCGQVHPIGAHRAYRSAGAVLRCPGCGAVAATIASLPSEHVIGLTGAWRLNRAG